MTNKSKKKGTMKRRAFLITGGILGTGLVVGVGGLMYINKQIQRYSSYGMGESDSLNAYVHILPNNQITLAVPRAEMGQGVYTSVPMLIAEELEIDMNQIEVVHPQPEGPYANTVLLVNQPRDIYKGLSMMEKVASFLPVVGTGGSTTIRDGYDNFRMMGALAREQLIRAAAGRWNVSPSDCYAEKGHIINRKNKEKLAYGELSNEAATIKIKELPKLKDRKSFKILGKPVQRLDIPEKVTGNAEFGLDVRKDKMLYAVLRHPSVIGGTITAITNQAEVEAKPGIKKVVLTPYGVGVVADNTWRATMAAKALKVEEDDGGYGDLSTAGISKQLSEILDAPPIATPEKEGEIKSVLENSNTVLESTYEVPYLAHACMEPINCTVLIEEDKAEAWCGHQVCSMVQTAINEEAGIPVANIIVNTTYLGGGFGRRSEKDMVTKAAAIAKEMKSTPIQLVFTREDDMRNDMYRPAVASRFKGVVNSDGTIEAWDNKIALQSVSASAMNRIMPAMAPKPKDDPATIEGAVHLPYKMNNREISFGQLDLPIQVGYWRSVGNSQNGFFTECFMDELAHAAGKDPYEFRKSKLGDHPRFAAVLNKVAEMANWKTPLPEGKFRGIALHKSFQSIVGQVAEISKTEDGSISIDKFYCVIDCGNIVNPDTIEAQMESGIVFGLSAALYGEITWEKGSVVQQNFPQYDMVRMNVSPQVEVHIMDVDAYPGGVGEPGTPPAAPALANAIFAATGKRLRSLPLSKHGVKFV